MKEYADLVSTASHLPALELFVKEFGVKKVLEFGMGMYSTPFFVDNCEAVTSIEMQTPEWFERMTQELGDRDNWTPYLMLSQEEGKRVVRDLACEWLDETNEKYDLALVDGHAWTRVNVAHRLMTKERSPIIVLHDTEPTDEIEKTYRWSKLYVPPEYVWVDFNYHPSKVTTALVRGAELHEKLVNSPLVSICAYSS